MATAADGTYPTGMHSCYSILFLIIMKDDRPKLFKLVKTNSALDFLKNITFSGGASEGITFDKIQGRISFNCYTKVSSYY